MDWFTALLCSIFLALSGLALVTGEDYRRRDRALLVTLTVVCSLALFAAPAVSRYDDFLNWCAEHHAHRSWLLEMMADGLCFWIALWFPRAWYHKEQALHHGLVRSATMDPTLWTPPAPKPPPPEPMLEQPDNTASFLPPELLPFSFPPPPLPPKDSPQQTAPPPLPPRPLPQHTSSSPASAAQLSPSRASPLGPPTPGSSLILPSPSQSSPPHFSPLQPSPAPPAKGRKLAPSPLRESMVASYTPEGSPNRESTSELLVAGEGKDEKVES